MWPFLRLSRVYAAAFALALPLFLASPQLHANPLRSQIEAFARTVDNYVSSGQFAYMDTMLAPDCEGQSTLTDPMNCKDMYFVELGDLFASCGSECATGIVLKHQVVEVAPMTEGDAWAWMASKVTSPAGTCLTNYVAHNRFARVPKGWQMTRILLMRVPCED